MAPILYILLVSGLFVLINRYAPVPVIRKNVGAIEGLFLLGCFAMGGAIGFFLPAELSKVIGLPWSDGWLERAAKVFGAVGGVLIAVRGTVIWATIFVGCVVLAIVGNVIGYVFSN